MAQLNSVLSNAHKHALHTALAIGMLLLASASARGETGEDFINAFQRISNTDTPFGVTDGNPQAATAFFASDAYAHFGLRPTLSTAPKEAGQFQAAISGTGGTVDTKSVSQYYVSADIYLAWKFTDTAAVALSLAGQYRNTHNVDTYVGGINLGFPITVVDDHAGHNSWVLTPWFLAASASGSRGLAQGGYLFGGGITSSFTHRWDKFSLTLANQVGYDAGFPLGYSSEFNFEQNISQFILKNGLQAAYDFTDTIYADCGVTYTNFLKGAYTDNYFTYFAGLGFKFGPASGVRVGYIGDADFSNEYYTYGGEVELYFTF